MSRPRPTTVDPWPRTEFAWQRTLLSTAAVSIALMVTLAIRGHGLWGIPVLVLGGVVIPFATIRARQIRSEIPRRVSGWFLVPAAGAVLGLSLVALLMILLVPAPGG